MEIIECIRFFLSSSWDFFTEIEVPGLGISFAALLVGFFLAGLGLRFLLMMLGAGVTSKELSIFNREDKPKK